MRSVQVVNQATSEVTRANHVIGFDESGNVTQGEAFALSAVRSARGTGERIAEVLIECNLNPWRSKSKQLVEHTSRAERDARVENLITRLESEPIAWRAAVGYESMSIHHKAAALCTISQKTITGVDHYSGDAVIIPDGADDMYGNQQRYLRQQASQMFGGSFPSIFGEVYISALPKADLTYPEVAAADYLSGYLRSQLRQGMDLGSLPPNVVRFDYNWREPETSPAPFYTLQRASSDYGAIERRRIMAWVLGRHPEGDEFDTSSQFTNRLTQMLESETVQQHLSEI